MTQQPTCKRTEIRILKWYQHSHVYGIIRKSQDVETTPNVHQDMDRKRIGGIYTQWNIIQLKKRNPAICNNIGETENYNAKLQSQI